MNDKGFLGPEDYAEPRCLLCDEPYGVTPEVRAVPQQRIIEKMNDYMSRRDYAGAERHLLYWLEEAKLGFDKGGELMIRNELVGHYRKTGEREKAFENADIALALIDELSFEGTVSSGTTYINIATAYNAFGENEKSIELFKKAAAAYENNSVEPSLLGGLYNNMALTYVALGEYDSAYPLYDKALEVMKDVRNGELEQAITCLNIADALEAQYGEEAEKRIFELVDRAYECLNLESTERDGYYAFVCEKCAPVFSYYGYFIQADELKKRAESIYERN
ncbi:MAG: tetratricopeptide repeat protein [Eubacterium sp.]|nr:tetratricopeptide repeat protein [Eubacterium sp.]